LPARSAVGVVLLGLGLVMLVAFAVIAASFVHP